MSADRHMSRANHRAADHRDGARRRQWFGPNRHAPAALPWHLDRVETAGSESLARTLSLCDGDVDSPFWQERFRAIYTVTFA
jgi:hypothetical protein